MVTKPGMILIIAVTGTFINLKRAIMSVKTENMAMKMEIITVKMRT